MSTVVFKHQLREQVWLPSLLLFANAQDLHGGGAGAVKSPTVPLRAASSDGHQMGLDMELIWTAITASGEGANWWRGEDATATIVHNQVNILNYILRTDGDTQLSLNPPVPRTILNSHSLCSGRGASITSHADSLSRNDIKMYIFSGNFQMGDILSYHFLSLQTC